MINEGWPRKRSINPEMYAAKSVWPKISIVTPSYNQGEFIEDTILSILNQNYPNLEYIIIDGGSNDNTPQIIQKYEKNLTYWICEPDNGQADAINKGLTKATGEIFNWINSDDLLAPNALFEIGMYFDTQKYDIYAGAVLNDFDNNLGVRHVGQNYSLCLKDVLRIENPKFYFHQPGVWLKLQNVKSLPRLNVLLYYYFDWEFMMKYLSKFSSVTYTESVLVYFRAHNNSKTISAQRDYQHEILQVYQNLDNFLDTTHPLKILARKKHYAMEWHQMLLNKIDLGGYSFSNFVFIIRKVLKKPTYRLTRLTIGQLKKFLLRSN
jgi:glycosyltransferase involved in cell wall biosynthesis